MVELHNFGQHDLHDDQIHECQAREFPVLGIGADEIAEFFGAGKRHGEQTRCESLIFVCGIGREKGLLFAVGGIETLDGLQHEGIDNLFIVVPIQTLFFEQRIESLIIYNMRFVEFSNDLTIGVIVFFFVVDVTLEQLVVRPKIIDFLDEVFVVGKEDLLFFGKFFECLIFGQLRKEAVFDHHFVVASTCGSSQTLHSRLSS